jgi:pimeloyl-ACP methyl ester carboxylesterase
MNKKQKIFFKIAALLAVVATVLLVFPVLCRSERHDGLRLVNAVKQSNHGHLVVITHGWFEKGDAWPENMAEAISSHTDPNLWLCGYFDWSKGALTINPVDAAQYASDVAGAALAGQILKLNGNLKHIHLIGHSSGCWAISEAAKILARQTKADIHLTFLDAYVPSSLSADDLGDVNVAADVNSCLGEAPGRSRIWADHYYTRDFTAEQTAQDLAHAHNVDVTDIDQLIKDHNFPKNWYYATITGSFPSHIFMDDKKLVTDANGVKYGFARSAEADPNAWPKSLKLPMGNKAVNLTLQRK